VPKSTSLKTEYTIRPVSVVR